MKSSTGLLRSAIRRLRPAGRRIYVVSYPKSGRTWLRLMVAKALELRSGVPVADIVNRRARRLVDSGGRPLPKVRFSHGEKADRLCQGEGLPEDHCPGHRVLLLVRDPRDVVVSHYHHARFREDWFEGTLGEFIRHRAKPDDDSRMKRLGLAACLNYMNAWANNCDVPSEFHLMHYEDLRNDTAGHFRAALDFLGLSLSDDELEIALQYGSLDNMRELERTNALDWEPLKGRPDGRGSKVRAGRVGGHREELSEEDRRYIEEQITNGLHSMYDRYRLPSPAPATGERR